MPSYKIHLAIAKKVNDKLKYSFNEKILLHGYLDYCEIFKLQFDDNNNLVDIENIK